MKARTKKSERALKTPGQLSPRREYYHTYCRAVANDASFCPSPRIFVLRSGTGRRRPGGQQIYERIKLNHHGIMDRGRRDHPGSLRKNWGWINCLCDSCDSDSVLRPRGALGFAKARDLRTESERSDELGTQIANAVFKLIRTGNYSGYVFSWGWWKGEQDLFGMEDGSLPGNEIFVRAGVIVFFPCALCLEDGRIFLSRNPFYSNLKHLHYIVTKFYRHFKNRTTSKIEYF